jgi:hypothetical protein
MLHVLGSCLLRPVPEMNERFGKVKREPGGRDGSMHAGGEFPTHTLIWIRLVLSTQDDTFWLSYDTQPACMLPTRYR